jgi:hypothetical protein
MFARVAGGPMKHLTAMPKTKVALTLDAALIEQVDALVERRRSEIGARPLKSCWPTSCDGWPAPGSPRNPPG